MSAEIMYPPCHSRNKTAAEVTYQRYLKGTRFTYNSTSPLHTYILRSCGKTLLSVVPLSETYLVGYGRGCPWWILPWLASFPFSFSQRPCKEVRMRDCIWPKVTQRASQVSGDNNPILSDGSLIVLVLHHISSR